jgi:ATPase subunit of ABC transporter with duplicated ATPase domains
MSKEEAIVRFEKVSFEYGHNKPILDEVSFLIRQKSKTTIMGQNGAGKSTIFKMITGELKPEEGKINIVHSVSIAVSRQVIARSELELTVREFFESCFDKKIYDIDPRIDEVLETVNLHAPHDKLIKDFSGGQQARLLLASALIQNPDVLLLDEPTNNLDKSGIAHLTDFLKEYKKTVIVISHDAEFLNSFSDGVLYLDVFTRKVEQYVGNYFDLLKEITARIEKENRKNAQLSKEIQENKDKANFFANKGGQMRMVAKRMREAAEEMEEEKVDVRREDKTIRNFKIPVQADLSGELLNISSFTTMNPKTHKVVKKSADVSLHKNKHLLLAGPNGIGKSTLLESLASGKAEGAKLKKGVRVGYYRQDFSTLNFEDTVYKSLTEIMQTRDEHHMRGVAASFLITSEMMGTKIESLSEGQKGLVAFARLVLQEPAILILDEPTNHINFRHLPVIAKALSEFQGAMILVSHVHEFVEQIRIDQVLQLDK